MILYRHDHWRYLGLCRGPGLTLRGKANRSPNRNDFESAADERFRCAGTVTALVATCTVTTIIGTITTCTNTTAVTDYSATTATIADHRRHHCRTGQTITAVTAATPAIGLQPAVVHYHRRRDVRMLSSPDTARRLIRV